MRNLWITICSPHKGKYGITYYNIQFFSLLMIILIFKYLLQALRWSNYYFPTGNLVYYPDSNLGICENSNLLIRSQTLQIKGTEARIFKSLIKTANSIKSWSLFNSKSKIVIKLYQYICKINQDFLFFLPFWNYNFVFV